MLGILPALFGVTVLRSLDKGIQRLSTLNVYLVLAFLVLVFLVDPTRYLVDAETNSAGQEAAIAAIIQTLPMSRLMLLIYSICCFVFLATTVSSTAYTLSSMTSKHLSGYDQPTTLNRLVWALVFIAFSAGIIIGGGFATVQVVCVIAGFPLIFIVFVLMRAIRNLQKEAAREAVIPPPEGS